MLSSEGVSSDASEISAGFVKGHRRNGNRDFHVGCNGADDEFTG